MQHGTARSLARLHHQSTNGGEVRWPVERTPQSRNAKPIISKRATKSAASPRRRPKSARGGRSTSRTRAARMTGTAARPAVAKPPRKAGRLAANTARADGLAALEDFDRAFQRAQLAVREPAHLLAKRR